MRVLNILRIKIMNPECIGPVKRHLDNAKETLKELPDSNHWFCGGFRTAAIAVELLGKGKIVALPTDTIYGLAGLAQNDTSVAKLYEIKKRDANKPLAICLSKVDDIRNWAHIDDLPAGLTRALLPGPTTLVLKRKNTLNPSLNPGMQNIGIRIPAFDFVCSIVKMINQPIALTSANISNKKSTLHPSEFTELWPLLDGVFYEKINTLGLKNSWRSGSTVVNLSTKGEFSILRQGIGYQTTMKILKYFNLKESSIQEHVKSKSRESVRRKVQISEEAQASALS